MGRGGKGRVRGRQETKGRSRRKMMEDERGGSRISGRR